MAAPWSFDVLAFFSTEGGRRPFRHLKDTKPSVIIRTNKDLDVKNYVIQLRQAYPQFCSSIFQMSQDGKHFEPRWFFDEHDFHVQGGRFLYDVVSAIIVENQAMLNRFCKEWSEANKENSGVSHLSKRALGVEFFFHAEDRRKWGDNFLRVALDHMMAAFTAAQDQHLAGTQKTANMQGNNAKPNSASGTLSFNVNLRRSNNVYSNSGLQRHDSTTAPKSTLGRRWCRFGRRVLSKHRVTT